MKPLHRDPTRIALVALVAVMVTGVLYNAYLVRSDQAGNIRRAAAHECTQWINAAALETTMLTIAQQGGVSRLPAPEIVLSQATKQSCGIAGITIPAEIANRAPVKTVH